MNRHWTLTDLEFVVRWDGQRSGVLPAPFVFTSDIRSYRAFETLKAETAERLSGDPATVPDDVLNIVARPDIRIIGSAWDPQHPNDPAKRIRLHAARRSGRGVLITQLPGRTIWHSGGFTITEHHELALA
ncbi:MAG: hypothetical protein HOQ24_14990, partial [Mycobacteriaceae bacterium]|nr:hypothetical protein [Mycobacteriaceae bacterium]